MDLSRNNACWKQEQIKPVIIRVDPKNNTSIFPHNLLPTSCRMSNYYRGSTTWIQILSFLPTPLRKIFQSIFGGFELAVVLDAQDTFLLWCIVCNFIHRVAFEDFR